MIKLSDNSLNIFDNKDKFMCVPTESKELNYILGGGWTTNELYMVIAPSGNGKSTFFRRATIDLCKANQKVLYISFEEEASEVLNSICALACGIKYQKRTSNYTKQEVEEINAFSKAYLNDLVIGTYDKDPDKDVFIAEINAIIDKGYKYIIIDYASCLDADEADGTYKYLKDFINDLQKLANSKNVCIITGAQTNRLILSALKEKDFDPRNIDYNYIEKSVGMAQKCTVGISLFGRKFNSEKYGECSYRYINVWKNRNEGILRCLYYKENENDYTRSYKNTKYFDPEWLNKDKDNKS